MRLDRFLTDRQVGSRREVRTIIRAGAVTVDGAVVKDPGAYLPEAATVALHGRVLSRRRYFYYMLNKPAGVLSAARDRDRETVTDLLPARERRPDLFPVGRLDRDTEGLLLITNDGALAHRLLSPRSHVDKSYLALVAGRIGAGELAAFREGIALEAVHAAEGDAFTTAPAELEVLEERGEVSLARVTLREGKFHQIRRMFVALSQEVLYLKRLSMGTLTLDPALAAGESRPLTEEEIRALGGSAGEAM